MAQFRQKWNDPPTYTLEVSRGYVRPVRSGGARYRFRPRRFHLDADGEWREVEVDADLVDDGLAAELEAARHEQRVSRR